MEIILENAVDEFYKKPSLEMVYFEAVSNSIYAKATEINIIIEIDSFDKPETLKIEIQDNGEGFTEKNFSNFSHLLKKEDRSHKGLGRLVFLKYFDSVDINSKFENQIRTFKFDLNFKDNSNLSQKEEEKNHTSLIFSGYKLEKIKTYDYLKPSIIKDELIMKFFPMFYSYKVQAKQLLINIHLKTENPNNEKHFYSDSKTINTLDLPDLEIEELPFEGTIFEKLELKYSIIQNKSIEKSITTAICVDDRTMPIDIIKKDGLPSGYQIIFILYSDYFIGKVDSSREELTLEPNILETIKRTYKGKVTQILNDKIPEISEKNLSVTKKLHDKYPHLLGYFDEKSVGLIDRNVTLETAQLRFIKAQQEILDTETMTDELYEKSLEISSRTLAEYIIYRKKIIEKLKTIDIKNSESDIHNIIVPKRKIFKQSNLMNDIYSNNAWLLDDKYMSYLTILSEQEMSKLIIELSLETDSDDKRPDIAIVFSNDPNNVLNEVENALLIDIENNTLDILLDKTYKKLLAKNSNENEYIDQAYKYFKNPELIDSKYSTFSYDIGNPYPLDNDDLKNYYPKEVNSASDLCNTPAVYKKYHESDYKKICSEILMNDASLTKLKDKISENLGSDQGQDLVNKGIISNQELQLYQDILRGSTSLTNKKEEICNLIDRLNANVITMCGNKKEAFKAALINYFHSLTPSLLIETYDNVTTGIGVLPKKNLEILTDLMVSDCEKYMIINTKINSSGNCEIVTSTAIGFADAREKYISSFLSNKEINIQHVQMKGHNFVNYASAFVPPFPNGFEKDCFFNIEINNNQNYSKNRLIDIANNVINKYLQPKINEQKNQITTNNNSIELRLSRYKELINGLDVFLNNYYPYVENKISSNSDYNNDFLLLSDGSISEHTCYLDNDLFREVVFDVHANGKNDNIDLFDLFKDPAFEYSEKGCSNKNIIPGYDNNTFKMTKLRDIEKWNLYYNIPSNGSIGNNSTMFYHNFKSYNTIIYNNRCQDNNTGSKLEHLVNKNLHLANKSRCYTLFNDYSYYNLDKNVTPPQNKLYNVSHVYSFSEGILSKRNINKNTNHNNGTYNSIFNSQDLLSFEDGYWSNNVIPINFNIVFKEVADLQTKSDKDNASQSFINNNLFSAELIWLSYKKGFQLSCDDMVAFDYSAGPTLFYSNTSTSCNIIYKFDNEFHTVDQDILQKAACNIVKLEDLKNQIITKISEFKTKLNRELDQQLDTYIKDIPNNLKQSLSVSYNDQINHFTLYYYDRAGNLVRTVPPKGVNVDNSATRSTLMQHNFVTYYKYNSKGQVISSDSPDESQFNKFIYSKLGHLKYSQSARQGVASVYQGIALPTDAVSYIRYDKYMRVIENGELIQYTPPTNPPTPPTPNPFILNKLSSISIFNYIENQNFPDIQNDGFTPNDLISSGFKRTFVIKTDYSENTAIPGFYGLTPLRTNLNNKVNFRLRDEDGNLNTKDDQVTTYYSYDIHGNVNFIIQDLPANNKGVLRLFARTDYEYDLISKKVKSVKYNYYQSDSHLQEYSYDEDNRLTKVRTSRYGYLWDQDATYQYYPHGPLRRISLGHDILQGIDYSYTIQGWLKAINHVEITSNAGTTKDPGRDGIPTVPSSPNAPTTAYDGFSEILNYFNGDYVHQVSTFSANRLNTQSSFAPLFNGNIASIENNYKLGTNNSINFAKQLDFTFKYDYINRLKESNTMFRTNNSSPAVWTAPSVPPALPNDYNTGYTYDPNGNILTLGRAQHGVGVDAFTYNYINGTNQLTNINDVVPDATFSDDIDNQPNAGAYNYDASGNQITDVGGVANIQWTVDGKVKAVNGSATQLAKYVYDASGNRVMKQTPVMNTIYARDANSQVMAIYESGHVDPSNAGDPDVTPCINISIKEEDYGSNCTMNYTICGNDYSYDVNTGIVTILAQITSTNLCFGVPKYLQPQTKILLNPVSLAIDGIQTTTGDMPYVTASLSQKFTVSDISKMPKLSEWHIYGNEQQGRFSVKKPDYDAITDPLYYLDALTNDVTKKNFFRILDKKQYELKDHLGNVRVAIGDMKIPTAIRGEAPFFVDEKSVSDFYPGGMSISDRSWQGTNYRYGYNAQEKSLEIDASGNHHTAEFWEVDNARLGRWNTDPVIKPNQSGYSIFGNNSINRIDPNGDDDTYTVDGTNQNSTDKSNPSNKGWDESMTEIAVGYSSLAYKNNEKLDRGFKWSNDERNAIDPSIRQVAAEQLAKYILDKHKARPDEDITIIGYSYGGDVALRASILIDKALGGKTKITVVSLSAPLKTNVLNEIAKHKSIQVEHFYIDGDKTVSQASFWNLETAFVNDGKSYKNINQYHLTKNILSSKDETGERSNSTFNLLLEYGGPFKNTHGWPYYPELVKKALSLRKYIK